MEIRRIKQAFKYGWQHASEITQQEDVKKSRYAIFADIMYCFLKYNLWSNQYKKEKVYSLTKNEKIEICRKYQKINTQRDLWVKDFFENYRFLRKWSDLKYEQSAELQKKRNYAYTKRYGLGENCFIGYGVILNRHHYYNSKIITGKDCLISEDCIIDYTGGITLGNKVSISEGTKILSHNHEVGQVNSDYKKGCYLTPLKIEDRVWIGSRCLILPGVVLIGRGALIGAGSVVDKKVPPYAIVKGNPAKIVGFRFMPEEIVEMERVRYPEDQRIPIEELEAVRKKYYNKEKRQLIREFLQL